MALRFLRDGVGVRCTLKIDGEGKFRLSDGKGDDMCPLLASPLSYEYEPSGFGYDTHFFVNSNLRESDIFQVYESATNKRVGWLVPALALDSNLHDYAENEHFLRYARGMCSVVLNQLPENFRDQEFELSEISELSFSSLLGETTAILVISREVIQGGVDFEIARAVVSLAAIGLICPENSVDAAREVYFHRPQSGKLTCLVSSRQFGQDAVVLSLVRAAIGRGVEVVTAFFYLYQIIELLIERVYLIEQRSVVQRINECHGDVGRVRDALRDLNDCLSEKERISRLMATYAPVATKSDSLISASSDLAANLGLEAKATLQGSLYPIRNFVFHRYRDFPQEHLVGLERVNAELVQLVPYLLKNYVEP